MYLKMICNKDTNEIGCNNVSSASVRHNVQEGEAENNELRGEEVTCPRSCHRIQNTQNYMQRAQNYTLQGAGEKDNHACNHEKEKRPPQKPLQCVLIYIFIKSPFNS